MIIVHIANLPSFLKRTIYYNPWDWKNLNRVYPGRPDGTNTERIASAITQEVIERSDYLVDLHCGDGNEALLPYAARLSDNAGNAVVELQFFRDNTLISARRWPSREEAMADADRQLRELQQAGWNTHW